MRLKIVKGGIIKQENSAIVPDVPQFCGIEEAPKMTCKITGHGILPTGYRQFIVIGEREDDQVDVVMNIPTYQIPLAIEQLQKAYEDILNNMTDKERRAHEAFVELLATTLVTKAVDDK